MAMTPIQQRAEAVRLMKSREKKNSYSQARPGNFWGSANGKGSGDCSLSVQEVVKSVTGVNIGGNTDAQIVNAIKGLGIIVDIPDGLYFDESKLLPGDALYFRGNTSHTKNVGHVEMYTGKNQCTGHGGGTGPTVKNLKTYCASRTGSRRALCAVRWIKGDEPTGVLGNRTLMQGDVGDDVLALKNLLIDWGYGNGKAPGNKYGAETVAAVIAWQYDNGLPETGITNADDYAKINQLLDATGGGGTGDPERPDGPTQYVTVTGGNTVYVRSAPGTDAAIMGVAYRGDAFEYAGQTAANGWHSIAYGEDVGWIGPTYTTLADAPITPTPTVPANPQTTGKDIVIADLSQHNDLKNPKNDWAKIAKSVDLLILRCGVTRTETKPIGIGIDDDYAYAAKQCIKHGIPFGVYFYGKVNNAADARKEADKAWETASPYNPLFYVYDVEEGRITDAVIFAWEDQIRQRGARTVGMYVGHNYYAKYKGTVSVFDFIWIPRYGKNTGKYDSKYTPAYLCDIHQYTSLGDGHKLGLYDDTVDLNRLTGTKPLSWFLGR